MSVHHVFSLYNETKAFPIGQEMCRRVKRFSRICEVGPLLSRQEAAVMLSVGTEPVNSLFPSAKPNGV